MPGLDSLVTANLAVLRTEFGRLRRQVSGYSLEHLLPENGASLARTLAGTEGTVVTMLGATVSLVPVAAAHALVVLGYPDVADAADAVPAILAHAPLAIEGLDARMVDVVRRRKGSSRVPELPPGDAWLMVEMGADSAAEAVSLAQAMVAGAGAIAAAVIPAGPEASAIWRIREDGAGLGGRTPANKQAWPGWEDAAVQPDRLGAYLREFRALLGSYRLDGLLYGHFGDGCIHVRIDFPLDQPGGPGVMRQFLTDAAHLVAAHGGSLSGEHGDGRARSELLPVMYSPDALAAFGAFKHLLDPADLLNPGVLVRPRPLDADLRRPAAAPLPRQAGFAFAEDDGDLTTAVHRCVGVGKCRADSSAVGRLHVPLLPRHPGREGLHPGPRAGAAGDGQRHPGLRRLEIARGARLAGPVPVLQGLLGGLPGRGGHGPVQVRGGLPRLPAAAAAALALRARPAAALGPAGRGRATAGQRAAAVRAAGHGGPRRRRDGHAARDPVLRRGAVPPLCRPPLSRGAPRERRSPARPGARWCCGPTRSATPSTRGCRRPPSRCSARPATRSSSPDARPAAG